MTAHLQPLALVTGFTIHGLAVARALRKKGVDVHAFTDPTNRYRPCSYTRHATVHVRDGLNSDLLVDHLVEFAQSRPRNQRIVLFPTSDRMSAAIARGWDRLKSHFLLSWSHCRDLVLAMQMKDNLPALAQRAGILHPRSELIHTAGDVEPALDRLTLPCIVKPVRPLSTFKAVVIPDAAELLRVVNTYPADLPFIVQDIVAGDEENLYACTTFLNHGRELCMATSRKLAASPPGLGQGTIFTTEPNPDIEALTRQFLAGLDLSGPVALEFKRDPNGKYWMIEPNVGRTEYCVDLAIQSGIDLPWIEYCHATGAATGTESITLRQQCTWFDTDKDPLCYLRTRSKLHNSGTALGRPVFPFFGTNDWKPLAVSTAQQALALVKQALNPF